MAKRRAFWVVVAWIVGMVATTAWVTSQAGDAVSTREAMLLGAIVGTVLAIGVVRLKRK